MIYRVALIWRHCLSQIVSKAPNTREFRLYIHQINFGKTKLEIFPDTHLCTFQFSPAQPSKNSRYSCAFPSFPTTKTKKIMSPPVNGRRTISKRQLVPSLKTFVIPFCVFIFFHWNGKHQKTITTSYPSIIRHFRRSTVHAFWLKSRTAKHDYTPTTAKHFWRYTASKKSELDYHCKNTQPEYSQALIAVFLLIVCKNTQFGNRDDNIEDIRGLQFKKEISSICSFFYKKTYH